MKYVMSDIHGNFDYFLKMLKLIKFSNEDILYILGDFIDRGDNPIELFEYIKNKKNIIVIKGNHEELYEKGFEEGNYSLWRRFGGETTYNQLLKKGYTSEYELYNYIRKLPNFLLVDNKFILVHAALYYPYNYKNLSIKEILDRQDSEVNLWEKRDYIYDIELNGFITITGHTPVQRIRESSSNDIIIGKNNIFIDCGCETYGKILGCLRLDDYKCFYIK